MAKSRSRHRAVRRTRPVGGRSVAGAAVAGVTAAGLLFGVATAGAAPNAYYLRGTNIGNVLPDPAYRTWIDQTIAATAGEHGGATKVDYPGGFWPVSKGYFNDPTWNKSADEGVVRLAATIADAGDADNDVIIAGHSQGAVAVTRYMRANPGSGNTYVLTANPNRPNGGVLQRFNGLYVPILDIKFNGATPTDGDITIDIARQYDGWADFPKYPLNILATANAVLGIIYLHGKYDQTVTAEALAGLQPTVHGNTSYYLIPTDRLPLLMPFNGIVPDSVLDALDKPLRALVELGYDRSDYGVPTTARLLPPIGAPKPADAPVQELQTATVKPADEPAPETETESQSEAEPDQSDAVDDRPASTAKRMRPAAEETVAERHRALRTTLRNKESAAPRSRAGTAERERTPAARPSTARASKGADDSGGSDGGAATD